MFVTLLVFILILGLLVFVHELGHFWAAKRSGVPVHEFAFGFRPKLFSWKRGETTYAINLLPFGGYVRLEGEDEDSGKKGSFVKQPIRVRAFVLVAGVAMNFLLAWVLLTGAYALGSFPLTNTFAEHPGLNVDREVAIAHVISGSPAEKGGLQEGDTIVSVNGELVTGGRSLIDRVRSLAGQEITIRFKRGDTTYSVNVTPRVNPPANEGALGVSLGESAYVHSAGWLSPWVGLKETGSQIVTTVDGVGQFFRQMFTRGSVSEEVSGIVGIGAATGVVRRMGLAPLLQFIALISTNLAVVNLLPILPLDGGHLLFLVAEKIRKRPVSEKIRQWVGLSGLVAMILLAIIVTYRDVIRFEIVDRIQSLF